MDPLSIVAFVVSVGQLIDAANKVNDIISTFKHGDKEIATLRNDIAAFVEALRGFDRILRSRHTVHRVSGTVLEDVLRNSMNIVAELKDRLLLVSSSSSSVAMKARLVQHKSALKKAHAKIREKIAMLHTFLSIMQAETILTMASQYPNFMISETAQQAAAAANSNQREGPAMRSPGPHTSLIGDHPKKDSTGLDRLGSSLSSGTSDRRLSIFSTTASVESSSTVGSGSSTHSLSSKDADIDGTLTEMDTRPQLPGIQAISQDMFILRRSCRYNCHCACHDETEDKPQRRFGRSKSQQGTCTDPVCLGNEAPPDNSQQHSSSFRSALSRATSTRAVRVRCDLQSFRMVPNGSNAVRYVNHGNLLKLQECIKSGEATIWDTTLDGWSLLHSAAYHGHSNIVKYLLDLGVSKSTGDVGSRTPADLAVLKSIGRSESGSEQRTLDIFGEKDDVLADFEFNPIHLCVLDVHDHRHPERPPLEELLDLVDEANNAPVDTDWTKWKSKFQSRSPLFGSILEYFRAAAFESPKGTKIIRDLLDEKDQKFHWTPLHWAAYSGRVKEMRTLVQYGASCSVLSNLGANIIHAAGESKHDSGLAMALKIRRMCPHELDINQVNSWGETAVHIASCISAPCVQLLLDAEADPNVRDENGQVALHFAASLDGESERANVITALCSAMDIEHINARDLHGRPPLFSYLHDPRCVEKIIKHGAKVDVTDNEGKNAFHHVCVQGHDDVLKVMLKETSHSNPLVAQDNNGNTPLLEALSGSNVGCAMSLLKLDDLGPLTGKDGWAPIHFATKIGEPELLQAVCRHKSFKKSAKTLDGKRAKVVAMEAGTWNGEIKDLILRYDYLDWDD